MCASAWHTSCVVIPPNDTAKDSAVDRRRRLQTSRRLLAAATGVAVMLTLGLTPALGASDVYEYDGDSYPDAWVPDGGEGPTPPPESCDDDAECGEGQICLWNRCDDAQACSTSADCWTDWCADGVCRENPECDVDADCGEGAYCEYGYCASTLNRCSDDADCELYLSCDKLFIPDADNGPQTEEDSWGSCTIDPSLVPASSTCDAFCNVREDCESFNDQTDALIGCIAVCSYLVATDTGAEQAYADLTACYEQLANVCVFDGTECPDETGLVNEKFQSIREILPAGGYSEDGSVTSGDDSSAANDGSTSGTREADSGCQSGQGGSFAFVLLLLLAGCLVRASTLRKAHAGDSLDNAS